MAITNIGELLERAQTYEAQLEQYYAEIRDKSADNGVRLLCYYFSRHRHHVKQALMELAPGVEQQLYKVKLKYTLDFKPDQITGVLKTPPETVKADELQDAAVAWSMVLVDMYRKIIDQPFAGEIRAFIESLIRIEERDIVMIKKMKATNYF